MGIWCFLIVLTAPFIAARSLPCILIFIKPIGKLKSKLSMVILLTILPFFALISMPYEPYVGNLTKSGTGKISSALFLGNGISGLHAAQQKSPQNGY